MTRLALLNNPLSQQNRRGLVEIEAVAQRCGILPRRLGDGAVQAVPTELPERRPAARRPKLALLPRGMTNMTTADGVLRLESIPDMPPQRGMFFGTGAIYRAIIYWQGLLRYAPRVLYGGGDHKLPADHRSRGAQSLRPASCRPGFP